jgi:hypothetical protein
MNTPPVEPTINLPVQAPAVLRDVWTSPAVDQERGGIEAAKTRCSDLQGVARQMCYASEYGVGR